MVSFPSPVGGTPLPVDFAPSILFAILYGAIIPLVVYRATNRRSRTLLLIGTSIFAIERTVFFVLRAIQAHGKSKLTGTSHGLTVYMQSSLGMGFIGIANDLVNLLRCLLVNPTYSQAMFFQSPAATTKGSLVGPPPVGTADHPEKRTSIRGVMGILGLAFLGASIPGIVANTRYGKALSDQHQADSTARLRIVSTAVVLPLSLIVVLSASWGLARLPRISKRGVKILYSIVALIIIVSIYRLAIMGHRSTSLADPDNPLNKKGAKAAFYIFHILPEWLATLILLGDNIRKTFGTGLLGDWRRADETEKQRRKREAKQAEIDRKKGIMLNTRVNNLESQNWN